jgi:DNA-binding Lrp family transcriptional regulator
MKKVKLDLTYYTDGRTYVNGTLLPLSSVVSSFVNVSVEPSEPGPYIEYFIKLADFNEPFQRPWRGSYHYTIELSESRAEIRLLFLPEEDMSESYRFVSNIDFNVLREYYERLVEQYCNAEEEMESVDKMEDWIGLGPIMLKRVISETSFREL